MSVSSRAVPAAVAIAAVAVSAGLLIFAQGEDAPPEAASAAPGADEREPNAKASDGEPEQVSAYDRELRKLGSQIDAARERARDSEGQWMPWKRLSALYVSRARLTGDYDDYLAAERALDRAFEQAPEGGGPNLARARLHFALHRLDEASEALERARTSIDLDYREARIAGLRGDILLHRGEYERAREEHRASEQAHPTSTSAFRLAQWHAATGDFDTADDYMERALDRLRGRQPRTEAYLRLNRGILDLDQGRHDEALDHYREANEAFGGWWLVEEHIAEIHALEGRTEEAIATYRDVVDRTGSPELMDALADALASRGETAEATELRARARQAFEQQLQQLPSAAYGHALEHFLAAGEAERALELARKSFELRPGGEARVMLARALARNDRHAEAKEVIEVALGSAYESAALHETAAAIFEGLGEAERAASERQAARAIAPD